MRKITYTLLTTLVLLAGCARDPLPELPKEELDGRVRLSIAASASVASDVVSKATDTDISGSIIALVFDKTDPTTAILKQKPAIGTLNGNKIEVLLYEEKSSSAICLLANIPPDVERYLIGLTAGTPLSEISAVATTPLAPSSGVEAPFPMSGWSATVPSILRASPPTNITIPLTRIVARIDVDGSPSNFQIHGVRLSNGAKRGYLLGQQILPYFGFNDVVIYDQMSLAPAALQFKERLYCYENRCVQGNTVHPTRVVVYGARQGATTPSYYGVDIVYPKTAGGTEYLNYIERNKVYTIKLNKVNAEGYATYEDALRSDPFNNLIQADIVVTDPYAYDLETNGKQYLGVTNSEFVLYPSEANTISSDLHITTISYTCASNWGAGSVTASAGITLLDGLSHLEVQQGVTPISRDIIVKSLAADFKAGTIKIEIGNLSKEINIRVQDPTMPTGQIMNDYYVAPNVEQNYKEGEVINPSPATKWLQVAQTAQDEGASSHNDKIVNVDGGIFIHISPFVSHDAGGDLREASLFVTGEAKGQRVRVLVQQRSADQNFKQIASDGYVGTFHRWNQTAERLIRMDAGAGVTWWHAAVLSGTEFIVVSAARSKDSGVGVDPHGVGDNTTYNTDELLEANGQIEEHYVRVSGTGQNIYFRLGLTSKLASMHTAPRYGLVVVSYGSGATILGTHRIFVRQGEAADYVMSPADGARSKAVRFAPYNLTDVLGASAGVVDRGSQGYNFVRYPSQGGYYFPASGTQAIAPTTVGAVTGLNPPPYSTATTWDPSWQECPYGYRRPNDGPSRAYTTASVPTDVGLSEVRQSLWQTPTQAAEQYDLTNHLVGYMADGYFDRRPIALANRQTSEIKYAVVGAGTIDAAYAGALIFHPTRYASLFVPFGGMYENGVVEQGTQSAMQLLTAGATDASGWLMRYGHFAGQNKYALSIHSRTSQMTGYAVRCIKDENPTVGSDDAQIGIPGSGGTQKVVSFRYDAALAGDLQAQVLARYPIEAERKQISDLALHATKTMSATDYAYLNSWADDTSYALQHLILRGVAAVTIPANALTSNQWRSVTLPDASTLATGAITTTAIRELALGFLSADNTRRISVQTGAMPLSMPNTNLYLRPVEFAAKATVVVWNGYTFKYIYEIK